MVFSISTDMACVYLSPTAIAAVRVIAHRPDADVAALPGQVAVTVELALTTQPTSVRALMYVPKSTRMGAILHPTTTSQLSMRPGASDAGVDVLDFSLATASYVEEVQQ